MKSTAQSTKSEHGGEKGEPCYINDKEHADRRTAGWHMIGAEATELIQGYAVCKTLETAEAELMQTVFPHPTLSKMMHESVLTTTFTSCRRALSFPKPSHIKEKCDFTFTWEPILVACKKWRCLD